MKAKKDVQPGTLALMVLRTLDVMGELHGYGIARRIEQISGDILFVNQGTLYPVLLRLEQEGAFGAGHGDDLARRQRAGRDAGADDARDPELARHDRRVAGQDPE